MTRPSTVSLALYALAWAPSSTAWTLTWRNSTEGATVVHETNTQNCTQIWHQKGQLFSWDPEGKWCLNFYKDVSCTEVAGWSCDGRIWRKDASRNLPAYDVYAMPPDSIKVNFPSTSTSTTSSSTTLSEVTTTTASTTTTTTPASSTATATSTSSAAPDPEPSKNTSLSGGAIAGIVIGAVGGLAVLAALFFCLGRRNRRAKQLDNPPPASPSVSTSAPATTEMLSPSSPLGPVLTNDTGSAPAYTYPADKMELAETEIPHAHGQRPYASSGFVELPGDVPGAELSNSRQLQELDGSSDMKRPLYKRG